MIIAFVVLAVLLAIVCYSITTYRLMHERCAACEKPARCSINWGVMLCNPFATRCVHCREEIK